MPDQKIGAVAVRLAADNFTPPSRTPWGGERIRALKGMPAGDVVGEAWELSVEPSFESCDEHERTLASRLAEAPAHWLGAEASSGAKSTALLVKLLDAARELSVQIHPQDGYDRLAPDESGKPEAWYVVDRDDGAGIYLGLANDVEEAMLRSAIVERRDVSKLLPFIPVEPGDFFVIEAGTPHCIGAGVFVVEPQRVQPGRRGVTYRYWDWNREYDSKPRELHVEDALAVTRWKLAGDDSHLDRVRLRTGGVDVAAPARCELLAGDANAVDSALASSSLRVARLSGHGSVSLPDWDGLGALTVLGGRASLDSVSAGAGQTLAVAARAPRVVELDRAHAIFSGLAL